MAVEPTWDENPLDDDNWLFQFHSLVWLDALRIVGVERDDAAILRRYEATLRSYLTENPRHLRPHRRYAWYDMGVGLRGIVLVGARLTLGDHDWLLDGLEEHGACLADPAEYEGKGNHALHQDMGLIAVGSCLGRRDLVSLARERIEALIPKAIDDEGVSLEGSVGYHLRNLRWYGEAIRRLLSAGEDLPADLGRRLRGMPEFLLHATLPDGTSEMIGDTNLTRTPRRDMAIIDRDAPPPTTRVFRAGYVFGRSSWLADPSESSFYSLRFGPGRVHSVHGHEDAGSLTFFSHGERLLWDSGMYAYEGGPLRVYAISRASHNVVHIPDAKYYITAESELIHSEVTDDFDLATVRVRSLQGADWHRTVYYSKTHHFLLVDDRVQQSEQRPAFQQWNLPMAVGKLDYVDGAVQVGVNDDLQLRFYYAGGGYEHDLVRGQEEPLLGWRSTAYRQAEPSPMLRSRIEATNLRFTTLILPVPRDAEGVQVAVERGRAEATATVVLPTGEEHVTVRADGVEAWSSVVHGTRVGSRPTVAQAVEACQTARASGDEVAYRDAARSLAERGPRPGADGAVLSFEPQDVGRSNVYAGAWVDEASGEPVFFEKCLRRSNRERRFWTLASHVDLTSDGFELLPPMLYHDLGAVYRLVFPYVDHRRIHVSDRRERQLAIRALAAFSATATSRISEEGQRALGRDPVRDRLRFAHSEGEYIATYPQLSDTERREAVERGQQIEAAWGVVQAAVSQLPHGVCHNDPGPDNLSLSAEPGRIRLIDWGNVSRGPLGQDLFIILRHLWRSPGEEPDAEREAIDVFAEHFTACAPHAGVSRDHVELAALSAYAIRHGKLLRGHDPHRTHIRAQELALDLIDQLKA